jgi:hypothetical protein
LRFQREQQARSDGSPATVFIDQVELNLDCRVRGCLVQGVRVVEFVVDDKGDCFGALERKNAVRSACWGDARSLVLEVQEACAVEVIKVIGLAQQRQQRDVPPVMEVDVFEAQLGAVWGALWHSTPRVSVRARDRCF